MSIVVSFLFEAIRTGMVFLFGATGETITEKSGHLNMGIPGIMCVGAASGCVATSLYTQAVGKENVVPFLAVLIPIIATVLCGGLLGMLYCFMTVTLRANQNVTGLSLTTLGIGIANYMISTVEAENYTYAYAYFTKGIPGMEDWGWFGKLFFSYGVMIYLAIALALLSAFILRKTRIGLHLRAVGENPATADADGINVTAYRYIATVIGSGIAALGGLCYVMDILSGSWEYVIDGIGWLSVALVIFTIWKPDIGIIGSILFGVFYIISSYIPGVSSANKSLLKMLPYLITIVVLIITSIRDKKEDHPPEGLGQNYYREER